MKKRICILFAFLLVFVMVGCTSNNQPAPSTQPSINPESSSPEEINTPVESKEPSTPSSSVDINDFITDDVLNLYQYSKALGYEMHLPEDFSFQHDGKTYYVECNSISVGLWVPKDDAGNYINYSVILEARETNDPLKIKSGEYIWKCHPDIIRAYKIGFQWLRDCARSGEMSDPFVDFDDHWIMEFQGVNFSDNGTIDAIYAQNISTEHIVLGQKHDF